ncbi:MAG: tetratricopeptide repeat protein [Candidatus Obscuribacterales bacterium]
MSKRKKAKKKEIYEDKWSEYYCKGLDARNCGKESRYIELMHKAIQEGERIASDPEEAEEYGRSSIDDMIAGPLANLGNHYLRLNQYEKARGFLERALELRLKDKVTDFECFIELVEDISETYEGLHLHSLDIETCNRILDHLEQRYGPGAAQSIPVLRQRAMAYESLAFFDSAESDYRQMVKIAEKSFGTSSSQHAEALDELDEFHEEKQWGVCDCHPVLTKPPL